MAIYLDEDHLGKDSNLVGFPHLLVCMGIAVLTRNFIYGVHIVEKSDANDTIPGFGRFLGNQGVDSRDMIALYGCCNFKIRYGDGNNRKDLWKAELRHIAGVIGFAGSARGFDTSIINPADGTYVEYVRTPNKNKCKIFYKRNEKMNYTGQAGNNVSRVVTRLNRVTLAPEMHIVGARLGSHGAANIIATNSNKGRLHEVNYAMRLKEFTI